MTTAAPPGRGVSPLQPAPRPEPPRKTIWPIELYRSAVGKKYVMAVTGLLLMGYVLAHMVGNLKLYLPDNGAELNEYAEWLRGLLYPAFPRTVVLWIMRLGLLAATLLHIHAAYALTVQNRRARPQRYQGPRSYVAADFAARTMRWTGVIIALFVLFHLADLTWGFANPDYVHGEVYDNVIASFSRPPVAILYVIANLALGFHLYHGVWSLFQSLGLVNRRFNAWRRYLAVAFAVVVAGVNVTFPLAVLFGVIP